MLVTHRPLAVLRRMKQLRGAEIQEAHPGVTMRDLMFVVRT